MSFSNVGVHKYLRSARVPFAQLQVLNRVQILILLVNVFQTTQEWNVYGVIQPALNSVHVLNL
jgi:hypothetical protein